MKVESYLNVIEKLNSEIVDDDNLLLTTFDYTTNGYVDIISFMDYVVFDSEMDETYSEEHLENMIRERMLVFTNALCKWLKYDGF